MNFTNKQPLLPNQLFITVCLPLIIAATVLITGCRQAPPAPQQPLQTVAGKAEMVDTSNIIDYDTSRWTELTGDDGYVIDIKYATTDNFVNEAVYPCGRCFLTKETAVALAAVRDELKQEGYKLKLFDCYRPRPVQQKLWDKVPNPSYVARPSEGSMHNRGVAVDLTLTDRFGKELDMGTAYDYFGKEAHHDYTDLTKQVLGLRTHLKIVMESHGFASIRTEWWHYSLASGSSPLQDWQWSCN